ncbi:MAG TPA: GNAT family N-acetyltransferase [Pyrinomonadaceae bacterium]|jgi:N-acetylglutamate synthase-like GNAT family acetyltransferase
MSLRKVSIRFATPADLDFVQQDHYLPAAVVERKIQWQEIIVAELNGVLAGYVRLEYLWSLIPYIALIHVLPEYRRQGIGKALLAYTEEFLREQGYKSLYSSSQVDEAEPQAWHRHVGFEECGVIAGINRGGIGELFFRKQL